MIDKYPSDGSVCVYTMLCAGISEAGPQLWGHVEFVPLVRKGKYPTRKWKFRQHMYKCRNGSSRPNILAALPCNMLWRRCASQCNSCTHKQENMVQQMCMERERERESERAREKKEKEKHISLIDSTYVHIYIYVYIYIFFFSRSPMLQLCRALESSPN